MSSPQRRFSDTLHRSHTQFLARTQPQLENLAAGSFSQSCWISVYDYDEDWIPIKNPIKVHVNYANPRQEVVASDFVGSLRHRRRLDCQKRVIFIEDLCFDLINPLTSTFDLSPEVTGDYLVHSGWTGLYDDSERYHWKTRRLKQEHVTVRWHRPGTLSLARLGEESLHLSRDSTLRNVRREVKMVQLSGERPTRKIIDHHIFAVNNIWRRHVDFRTSNDREFCDGDPIAWEERCTIWRRQEDDCLFMIVFVDPSPLAATKIGPEQNYRQGLYRGTGNYLTAYEDLTYAIQQFVAEKKAHQSATLHPNPDGTSSDSSTSHLNAHGALPQPHQDYVTPALPVNVAFDQTYMVQPSADLEMAVEPTRARRGVPVIWAFPARSMTSNTGVLRERQGREQNPIDSDDEPLLTAELTSHGKSPRLGLILRNAAARGPVFDFKLMQPGFDKVRYRALFQSTTSTMYDLELWMKHLGALNIENSAALAPVSPLLAIVCNDLEDFFLVFETYLDRVEILSSNQDEVRKGLPAWRGVMNCVGEELRYLERSIPLLLDFLPPVPAQSSSVLQAGLEVLDIRNTVVPKLLSRVSRLEERTERALQALVASVSIIESRRGIDEAASVTKLTELAFFFIPISFAASFFGMQVKELNPSTTSLWAFFVMTAGIMSASYLIWFLRSQRFKDILVRHSDDIRRFKDLRADQRLYPTFIAQYLWEEKFAWIANAGCLLLIVVPIIPIWTSPLMRPIKLIISIATLLMSLALLIYFNMDNIQVYLARALTPNRRSGGYEEVEMDDDNFE